jgi:prephenate dehydrogenase
VKPGQISALTIVGVGLIGGSLARALKRAGAVGTITGAGRSVEHLERAKALGVIDRVEPDVARAAAGAEVVVLCAPLLAMEDLLRTIAPALDPGTVVTDAGSAKGSVVEAARRHLGARFSDFVPGHPIAGTEKSGVEASFAELFEGRLVILTPLPETSAAAVERIDAMWRATGAEVASMPVERHDRVLAATSHLPHMLAYGLVDCLARMQEREEIFRFAAGGFADFTRIASSSPEMWHDVCFSNRKALLEVLDRFDGHLEEIRRAVEAGDSAALLGIFTRAKTARDNFVAARKKRAG